MLSNVESTPDVESTPAYPARLMNAIITALNGGALVIERAGLVQVNHDGIRIFTALYLPEQRGWSVDMNGAK